MSCRAAMGRAKGPKEREGDLKTPEGRYFVCTRNDKSRYHLALGLSYPSPEDAQRGFDAGLVSEDALFAVRQAAEHGRRPPWDTPLGGFIMIHGGGSETDWTAGCVALDDTDMDRLWPLCPLGTAVEITP